MAHPDPQPTALFHDRVRAHGQFRGNPVLSRNGDAESFAVVGKSVIAADQYVVNDGAEGQRIAAVGALIGERHDTSAAVAIQRDGLAENRSPDWSFRQF